MTRGFAPGVPRVPDRYGYLASLPPASTPTAGVLYPLKEKRRRLFQSNSLGARLEILWELTGTPSATSGDTEVEHPPAKPEGADSDQAPPTTDPNNPDSWPTKLDQLGSADPREAPARSGRFIVETTEWGLIQRPDYVCTKLAVTATIIDMPMDARRRWGSTVYFPLVGKMTRATVWKEAEDFVKIYSSEAMCREKKPTLMRVRDLRIGRPNIREGGRQAREDRDGVNDLHPSTPALLYTAAAEQSAHPRLRQDVAPRYEMGSAASLQVTFSPYNDIHGLVRANDESEVPRFQYGSSTGQQALHQTHSSIFQSVEAPYSPFPFVQTNGAMLMPVDLPPHGTSLSPAMTGSPSSSSHNVLLPSSDFGYIPYEVPPADALYPLRHSIHDPDDMVVNMPPGGGNPFPGHARVQPRRAPSPAGYICSRCKLKVDVKTSGVRKNSGSDSSATPQRPFLCATTVVSKSSRRDYTTLAPGLVVEMRVRKGALKDESSTRDI
ncbi:hypothetical protein BDZ89DRAFT_1049040 [Hymenopellis radicata]|nr:hypothetical protein BDZ89DRAFT_1049040 [Hymenopellis radicata]